ncbi:MAG: glycosyltransferase family 4 protein [Bacteroidales bacterium]|nr:glycosyltransferase family 4 protein [Bacteroidales bacterium]
MKKIVHIVWSFNFGGIQTMVADLMNEQVKSNIVHFIIINDNIAESLEQKLSSDIKVYKLNRRIGSLGIFKIIRLNLILYSVKADVIHCHIDNQVNALFFIPKRKIYLTIHDVNRPIKNLKRYGRLFSISKSVYDDVLKRAGLESVIVYNGLRLKEIAVKKNYSTQQLKIIQISRLIHKKKGQDILLRAIHYLVNRKKFTQFKVSIVGEGESEEYLKKLMHQLEIADYVNFDGYRDRNYIYQNLKNYDLLVQPSRYEGFGITVIEAMAAGVPVLISDIDGPLEITQYGKLGYLFKSEDYIQFAEQIVNVWNDINSGIIKKKIKEAKIFADKTFSIQATSENYLKNY